MPIDDSQRPNPWRCRSQEVRYDNPWIRVEHHDVVTPAGGDGIYGVVHFKNVAVGVLPLDENLETWLVGQHRYPLGRYSWEIPEGGASHAEPPLDAAKRELLEEVGLEARSWEPLLELDLSNSVTDERAIIYLARDLTVRTAHPEDTEQLEVRKLPFDELLRDVLAGRVRDSLTVAAVLRLQLRLLGSVR